MYAVIFKAKVKNIDHEYYKTAERMRELAINEYACIGFDSVCEEDNEISISFWKSEEAIKSWKQNKEHLKAQEIGKKKYYSSYSVEIVKVLNHYKS